MATAIVTGATSGIGAAVTHDLLGLGLDVIPVGRDPARLEALRSHLAAPGPGTLRGAYRADLGRLGEVRRLAGQILAEVPTIDLLVNNAGALFARREVTPDGHERTWALNVLSPYLLTRLLEPRLRSGAPGARVVNVASEAHRGARLDFDDLELTRRYRGYRAYARSKLALVLLTRAFARRAPGGAPTYFAVHPGLVRTRFGSGNSGGIGWAWRIATLLGISPERAARTVVYAARAPELAGRSGAYIAHARIARPSAEGRDDAAADRLWIRVAAMVGLPP
jgi:retinol dehydrogenase-12